MIHEPQKKPKSILEVYESANAEGGLVRRIATSNLQPAEKDILHTLYEQGGRTVYRDKIPSFNDVAHVQHKPVHTPSLLYQSAVFLELSVDAMNKFIQKTAESELQKQAKLFYTEMHGLLDLYMPRDRNNDKFAEEVSDVLEEYCDWHIRSTLNAAKEQQDSAERNPRFKEDLSTVRKSLRKTIEVFVETLSQKDKYSNIVTYTSEVLERISLNYLDKEYSEDALQRRLLVNLFAGAYFLKNAAKYMISIEKTITKKPVPRHLERFDRTINQNQ